MKTKRITKCTKITTFVNTPFSKKFWFWPLMALIGLSPFLFYFYRLKINQQKYLLNEQKSLEKQRYTADLHGEVGSTLSQ